MWTGLSNTNRLGGPVNEDHEASVTDAEEARPVGGVVVNNEDTEAADTASPKSFNNAWRLNAVLALVCCWYAMTLTGWGSIENRGDVSNPDAGAVSMWMLIVSQWIALLLYLWTLIAPRLFPDRDFS